MRELGNEAITAKRDGMVSGLITVCCLFALALGQCESNVEKDRQVNIIQRVMHTEMSSKLMLGAVLQTSLTYLLDLASAAASMHIQCLPDTFPITQSCTNDFSTSESPL